MVGDFIIVDELMGTVEDVGLKTTHVRSLSGEELVFSNSDLLNSRIRNYKKMRERRIVFKIGVTYETPYDKLQAIPRVIEKWWKHSPEPALSARTSVSAGTSHSILSRSTTCSTRTTTFTWIPRRLSTWRYSAASRREASSSPIQLR